MKQRNFSSLWYFCLSFFVSEEKNTDISAGRCGFHHGLEVNCIPADDTHHLSPRPSETWRAVSNRWANQCACVSLCLRRYTRLVTPTSHVKRMAEDFCVRRRNTRFYRIHFRYIVRQQTTVRAHRACVKLIVSWARIVAVTGNSISEELEQLSAVYKHTLIPIYCSRLFSLFRPNRSNNFMNISRSRIYWCAHSFSCGQNWIRLQYLWISTVSLTMFIPRYFKNTFLNYPTLVTYYWNQCSLRFIITLIINQSDSINANHYCYSEAWREYGLYIWCY